MKKAQSEIEKLIQEMVEEELDELWGVDHLKNAANKVGGYAKQGAQAVGGAIKNAGRNVMNKITGTTPQTPATPPPIPKSPAPPIPDDRSVLDGHEEEGEVQPPPAPAPSSRKIVTVKCMNSSMVHSFEYNESDQTLRVYFRGGQIYDYFFVPREVSDGFQKACEVPGESAGKWFAKNVRNVYEFHKVA